MQTPNLSVWSSRKSSIDGKTEEKLETFSIEMWRTKRRKRKKRKLTVIEEILSLECMFGVAADTNQNHRKRELKRR